MTQSTNEEDASRMRNRERMATLPLVTNDTMVDDQKIIRLQHGDKVLDLPVVTARSVAYGLLHFAVDRGSARTPVGLEDSPIAFVRSEGDPAVFHMEWDGSHGPFASEAFLAWAQLLAQLTDMPLLPIEPRSIVPPWRSRHGLSEHQHGRRHAAFIGI